MIPPCIKHLYSLLFILELFYNSLFSLFFLLTFVVFPILFFHLLFVLPLYSLSSFIPKGAKKNRITVDEWIKNGQTKMARQKTIQKTILNIVELESNKIWIVITLVSDRFSTKRTLPLAMLNKSLKSIITI